MTADSGGGAMRRSEGAGEQVAVENGNSVDSHAETVFTTAMTNTCTEYLTQQATELRAQREQRQQFADRLGISVERLNAFLAASVRNPGARWELS